ncbi:DNA N-6-adenine-methyltransferase [Bosea sp. (in: a-proteobacteria)]|uniref:DNA N-6-adenine-methyltransferase n=1 Tax=Bosea sp. (in: a-proteobacteria) TaxID=1871050 RepID=UPI001AC34494|nr:DNA N-6-adenine-methyltransferase [Bosea sp. (in: a-proteobacteria)]MBN9437150.1 helix-turn-helix domain-containing protein [Bosea sp. (in: a-proteobacteria)]
MPTLFDDLRDRRVRSGLSLADIATKTGYTLNTIWELEIHGRGTIALFEAAMHALDLHIVGLTPGKALGPRLKATRLKRGLSIETLATRAGCSAGALARVESGQARVASMLAVASILAPQMRFAKPQVSRFEKGRRNWRFTPPAVTEPLAAIFGAFDLDPCGHPLSPVKAKRFFCEEDDGLAHPWEGDVVFVNPPYTHAAAFVEKSVSEWRAGRAKTVILLLYNQFHQAVWHDRLVGTGDLFILRGRIGFIDPDSYSTGLAPLGNYFAVLGCTDRQVELMLRAFDATHLPRSLRTSLRGEIRDCALQPIADTRQSSPMPQNFVAPKRTSPPALPSQRKSRAGVRS